MVTGIFQSTHPVRGATDAKGQQLGDQIFQSTHPVRGATSHSAPSIATVIFQSTHPVRGATLTQFGDWVSANAISIHAPREGCDVV